MAGSGAGLKSEPVLVEKNVDFQVATALKRYAPRIESGRLVVIGAVIRLFAPLLAGRLFWTGLLPGAIVVALWVAHWLFFRVVRARRKPAEAKAAPAPAASKPKEAGHES